MFVRDLLACAGDAAKDREIGITVRSVETGGVLATTYDISADAGGCGELMLTVAVEGGTISADTLRRRFNSMRKRRSSVKSIMVVLEAIRDAQARALENTPENLRGSENYESGEFAVEAIDEAVGILCDAY